VGVVLVGEVVQLNGTYNWQRYYEAAILETDRSQLSKLIAIAQAAIDERVAELRSHQNGEANGTTAEKQAIADALAGLRILNKEIS
jgi:hypothetical protein